MDEFLPVLAKLGCDLEFSPSMVWQDPIAVPVGEIEAFGRHVRGYGLRLCSMHSLIYPRPELTFFDGEARRRELVDYVLALGRLCRTLGIPHMVFGSARSRRIGERDREACGRILSQSFQEMAEGLLPLGIMLLIEPLSRAEADSVVGVREGAALVESVGHPNFRLHVDLRSTFVEKEDQTEIWESFGRYVRHCHVADPGFKPPSVECSGHAVAAEAMRRAGYDGYVSIEMERCSAPAVLERAVRFVQATYGCQGRINGAH